MNDTALMLPILPRRSLADIQNGDMFINLTGESFLDRCISEGGIRKSDLFDSYGDLYYQIYILYKPYCNTCNDYPIDHPESDIKWHLLGLGGSILSPFSNVGNLYYYNWLLRGAYPCIGNVNNFPIKNLLLHFMGAKLGNNSNLDQNSDNNEPTRAEVFQKWGF